MKKFTKLFLSCAAIAAVTAMVATSAMAAEKQLTGVSYTAGDTTGTVSITIPEGYTDTNKTLVVAKKGVDGLSKVDGTTETIMQIDQQANVTTTYTATLPKLVEGTDDGTYYVFMGGDSGDLWIGSFDIGEVGSDRLLGDVEEDGEIDVLDGSKTLKGVSGLVTLAGDDLLAADANDDGELNVLDGSLILKNVSGLDKSLASKPTIKGKTHKTVTK